ncbi:MAG: electron transport complex subunit RsxB [Proteobacteria bacterium]|nr:electron transport complex subunit RsxB [Pseudomonadota bacterium]
MPFFFAPLLADFVAALILGWLLGPALQDRFDEVAADDRWRGVPIRVFAAFIGSLPFAALSAGWLHWACAAVAWLGWLPGLLRPARRPAQTDDRESLIESIDRLLPQTQCGQCGFGGCRPYATAIAEGRAQINRCPPGGADGIAALAELLDRPRIPLDPACGVEKPSAVAFIVEDDCIGCTKCIQACPVDAIVGAPKRMHTVIADLCTGCELCVPPCPVDCIRMIPPANT